MGGYGAVYLARDVGPVEEGGWPELVAVKVALASDRAAKRAGREKELLSRVEHPNVVRCIEAGLWPDEPEGHPYLVMPYVPGPDLYTWAEGCNPRVREALEKFRALALALHAVHSAGVLHRDVKGNNIIVRESDGQPILLDFGVGDYEGAATLTDTQLPPGTELYRGPWMLRFRRERFGDFGVRYAFRVGDDLYALGVTWYRLMTGGYLFEEIPGAEEATRAFLSRPPAAPTLFNPCVPEAVSQLLLRLLAPWPETRHASAWELAEELKMLLESGADWLEGHLFAWDDGRSTHSRSTESPGPRERSKRVVRRRPRLFESLFAARVLGKAPPPPRLVPLSGRMLAGLLVVGSLVSAGVASLGSTWHQMMEEVPPVTAFQTAANRSPRSEESSASSDGGSFPKKCLALGGAMLVACTGAQVKPSGMECTEEARITMRALRMDVGDDGYLLADINQPLDEYDPARNQETVFRNGPLVSRLEGGGVGDLPEGTLLYGQMWVGDERLMGYYTRAKRPNGSEVPVCIALGYRDYKGIPKDILYSDTPSMYQNNRYLAYIVVDRFE